MPVILQGHVAKSQATYTSSMVNITLIIVQAKQQGSVGLSFDVMWFEPGSNTTEDIEAAQRAQDFQLGW